MKSKKGKIGSSGTPRRKKAKLAVRMQYGVLPYRFSQDAALDSFGYNAWDEALDRSQGMADQRIKSD